MALGDLLGGSDRLFVEDMHELESIYLNFYRLQAQMETIGFYSCEKRW